MHKIRLGVALLGVIGSFGGALSGPVGAIGGGALQQNETLTIKMDNSSQENGDASMKESYEGNLNLEANRLNEHTQITYSYPTGNFLSMSFEPMASNRYVKRVVLVYYDYENGVTEAIADDKLASLGEDNYDDWAVRLADVNYNSEGYLSPVNSYSTTIELMNELMENKRDLIYYAVEFGVPTDTEDGRRIWSETAWVRGKYDYRQCVHSEMFASAMNPGAGLPTCMTRELDDEYYRVLLPGADADEVVLSWQDEWRMIQKERLDQIITTLTTWEEGHWNKGDVEEKLRELAKLERTLKGSEGVRDLLVVEQGLSAWLNTWLNEQADDVMQDNSSQADNSITNTSGETTTVEKEVITKTEEVVNWRVVSLVQGNEQIDENGQEQGAKEDEEGKYGLTEEELAQVPALGETKAIWNWWWMVIPVVGGLGIVVLFLLHRKSSVV